MRTRTFTLLAITFAVSVLMLGGSCSGGRQSGRHLETGCCQVKIQPGPAPKESTLKIESQPDGLKFTIVSTDAEGKPIHTEASPKFDGKDYPMTGNPNVDSISLKKINDHTIETSTKKDGKPLTTNRSVVSKDGKTRTSTYTGKNAKGEEVNNIVVYNRQ